MSEVELPEGWDEALMSDVTADVPAKIPLVTRQSVRVHRHLGDRQSTLRDHKR